MPEPPRHFAELCTCTELVDCDNCISKSAEPLTLKRPLETENDKKAWTAVSSLEFQEFKAREPRKLPPYVILWTYFKPYNRRNALALLLRRSLAAVVNFIATGLRRIFV